MTEQEQKIINSFMNFVANKLDDIEKHLNAFSKYMCVNQGRELLETGAYENKLNRFGYKNFSQGEEDGIIAEILRRIGNHSNIFVEFGCANGLENNTTNLLHQGYSGLWLDWDENNIKMINDNMPTFINSNQLMVLYEKVTAENINGIISSFNKDVDVLSIDIDYNDYYVWKAIECINPALVVIEYNPCWRPPISKVITYNAEDGWKGGNYFGASLSALEKLGMEKGYTLIGCTMTGANAFFVRNEYASLFDLQSGMCNASMFYEPARYDLKLHQCHPPGYGVWLDV